MTTGSYESMVKCQVGRKCQGAFQIYFRVLRDGYSEDIMFLEAARAKR